MKPKVILQFCLSQRPHASRLMQSPCSQLGSIALYEACKGHENEVIKIRPSKCLQQCGMGPVVKELFTSQLHFNQNTTTINQILTELNG